VDSTQLVTFNRRLLVGALALLALCVVVSALLVAPGCSGSHHSSDATGDAAPFSPFNSTLVGTQWGQKECLDHCGVEPPRRILVGNWKAVQEDDLCGLPWDCHYRCSADCSKP